MSDTAKRPKARRTFSAFGDVRKMPTEYEIVTQGQNYTTRENRAAAFEQNPSSPPNLWFLIYREQSPLQAENWEQFREPDSLTYRMYVNAQAESEAKIHGVLEEYSLLGADKTFAPGWVELLGTLYTPSRYAVHGFQQIQAYIGYMAPTAYITNPAGLSTADFLRRNTTIAYRTRELQLAHPDSAIGTDSERRHWQSHAGWQGTRKAVESALISYDWGEALTALNLVLLPTLDDVLTRQFGEVALENNDNLAWLVQSFLDADNQRRNRWSQAVAQFAIGQKPRSRAAIEKWVAKWSPVADEAAAGLGTLLETLPESPRAADEVVAGARAAREAFIGSFLDDANRASA
jgi:toluene monooxygenase system protein E